MIWRANCTNKFTTVCAGHCNTCINGNTFGQPAVEQTELLQETFNKGYVAGASEVANYIIDYIKQLRYGQTEVAIVEELKKRFPYAIRR